MSATIADMRDEAAVQEAVDQASAVFHFAAQVAVTTSLLDPAEDLQVNLLGSFNLLQALRRNRQPCVFASTNKIYGKLEGIALTLVEDAWRAADPALSALGVDEHQRLDFCTPYGCSKGAADQYMLDYASSFGVPSAVMRMSCIYGPRQLGSEDQGWVAHFILRALAGEPITIYGDGYQVRDVLCVDDAVDAYVAAWRQIDTVAGKAFNLGGGPENAISLRRLVNHIGFLQGEAPEVHYAPWRPNDQRWYVSDTRHVRQALGLPKPRDWQSGVAWLLRSYVEAGHVRRGEAGQGSDGMRVALINPAWRFEHSIYFGCREPHLPLEFGYARALLEAHGHQTLMLDGLLDGLDAAGLAQAVDAFGADIAVVTTAPTYLFWRCAPPELRVPRDMIHQLAGTGALCVAVGPHGSSTPGIALRKTGADLVLQGECEEAILALAEAGGVPDAVSGSVWRRADAYNSRQRRCPGGPFRRCAAVALAGCVARSPCPSSPPL